MKQLSFFVLIILMLYSFTVKCSQTNFKLGKFSDPTIQKNPTNTFLPDGEVAWEGWVKYFKYNSGTHLNKPEDFYINNAFFSQRVLKKNLFKRDEGGYKYIQNKFEFYAKFLKHNFNILSNREDHYGRTVDTLDFDTIRVIDPSDPLNGAIKDLGKFKEGHCISINTLIPTDYDKDYMPFEETNNTNPQNWIICVDSKESKEKLMNFFISYRVILQKQQDIDFEMRKSENEKNQIDKLGETQVKKEIYDGPNANKNLDGYLILINDWTQCTVKCGGGYSYQQWRCIPPKQGGLPCQGELIRKRICNEEKCPGVVQTPVANITVVEETKVVAPIFKSMYFIDRPQQNVPCLIRENDILYEIFSEKNKGNVKLPGRVLMNNRTISVFKDSSYDHAVFNFNLDKTKLVPHKDEFCCFFLQSHNKRFKICGLASECGSLSKPEFVNSWKQSFSLFKNKCYNKFSSRNKDLAELDLKPKSKDNINQSGVLGKMNIESADAEEKEKFLENKLKKTDESNLESKIVEKQKTALKAITREMDLEERLKREEMMRAKEETSKLLAQMRKEEEKKRKLQEALDERENEDESVRKARTVNKSLDHITDETQKTILSKRTALKDKITKIRQKAERRKRLIQQKIELIRGKMAKSLLDASKEGNLNKCKDSKEKKESVIAYCDENILDDYAKNLDCKQKDKFCYICCETEFGNMQASLRNNCYDMCDGKEFEGKKQYDLGGDWAWK